MIWALILVIHVQGAQSTMPQIERLGISPQRLESFEACETKGKLLSGYLADETDPARQYAWQDYQCVLLK